MAKLASPRLGAEAKLNEGRRNLISYLQKRGYFDAKVTFRKISNSSNEFRVLYVIDPSGKVTIAINGKLSLPGSATGTLQIALEIYNLAGVGTLHCQTGGTDVTWTAQ